MKGGPGPCQMLLPCLPLSLEPWASWQAEQAVDIQTHATRGQSADLSQGGSGPHLGRGAEIGAHSENIDQTQNRWLAACSALFLGLFTFVSD